ncbi:MAG: phosphate signaling complex protein PhoU [Porticoccaceae bacterium]|jgi:phosphate transport system protein|nr:phosphate signaling complex protein PhoU [Porticoccaceae bacterium]MEA3298919.1 phosphate signaling complex protein PhoU [Pseudomonadota bacterium]HLS97220.1 phosphate signaling complex protein PhoU [Porticoccaceae bacterium]
MDKLHLDQHISRSFNDELEQIKTRMLEMGGRVENQVADAVRALEDADSQLAETVINRELAIDALEMEIDEDCTTLIARRQPAATDLRMVMAVTKTIRDLERMGDEAKKIAKMAIKLSEEGSAPRGYVEIRHIANGVRKMLNDTLDAFTRYDADSALATLRADDQVDLDYKTALRELVTYMMEDPRSISRVMNIMWALRSLERIGDHAKNICEQVVYLVRGKDIRHGNADRLG